MLLPFADNANELLLHLFNTRTLPVVQEGEFLHLARRSFFVKHQEEVFSYIKSNVEAKETNTSVKKKKKKKSTDRFSTVEFTQCCTLSRMFRYSNDTFCDVTLFFY